MFIPDECGHLGEVEDVNEHSAIAREGVSELRRVDVHVEFEGRLVVTLRWGDNPSEEQERFVLFEVF